MEIAAFRETFDQVAKQHVGFSADAIAHIILDHERNKQLEQINSTLDALLLELTNISYTLRNRS